MIAASPLEDLLERLSSGDDQAAEEVYRAYEPYLRLVVRRQLPNRLRAKFDSTDVVQSVWVSVLDHLRRSHCSFPTADHLRAFLVKSTRHRLIDRVRQHRAAVAVERPLATTAVEHLPAARGPRPSEVAQADDLWTQMLAACPAEYHALLELKRQGLPLAEIAQRCGLHGDSVRRILRKLARQLSFRPAPSLSVRRLPIHRSNPAAQSREAGLGQFSLSVIPVRGLFDTRPKPDRGARRAPGR